MRSFSIRLASYLLIAIVAGWYAASAMLSGAIRVVGSFVPRGVASNGVRDDADARARWELLRLRDPSTGRIPSDIRRRELEFAARIPAVGSRGYLRPDVSGYVWSSRGPNNLGGRTRALAVDVADTSVLLAGGVSGGIWRSSDRGRSWARTTTMLEYPAVSCIAQDRRPGHTSVWYYGTGEPSTTTTPEEYSGAGLYKSTDGGRSWFQLESTKTTLNNPYDEDFDWVWNVAVDPSNTTQDEVYAATIGGVMRSVDGGATWTKVVDETGTGDVVVTDEGVVYAVYCDPEQNGRSTVVRSADGVNWTEITPPGWPTVSNRWVIGRAPSNPNVVYVLGSTVGSGFQAQGYYGTEWSGLWKYTYLSGDGADDRGRWEDRSANLPDFGGDVGDFFGQEGYDLMVSVRPDDENTVYIGGANLYRSFDGFSSKNGSQWIGGYSPAGTEDSYPNHHPDLHTLVFVPGNPDEILTGSDGGVHRSENGAAPTVFWTTLNNGYRTTQFYSVSIDRATAGDDRILGGMQDNGTYGTWSANPSDDWEEVGGGDGTYCAIGGLAGQFDSYFVSFPAGEIYRLLTQSDGSPVAFSRIDPAGASGYLFIAPFLLDPSNSNVMYLAAGRYVWRNDALSTLPTTSNRPISNGWTRLGSSAAASAISAIGVSTLAPSHRVYYGSLDGSLYRLDDAHQGNPSRLPLVSSNLPRGSYVNCICVDPEDGNRAVVVFANYNVQSLFLTTDAGATWTPVGGNLEEFPDGTGNGPSCRWVSILHRQGRTFYFLGTSTGLYSTTELNGMSTVWEQEGIETIGNAVVEMLDVRQSDGRVVVGTHGNGVFSTTVTTAAPQEPGTAVGRGGTIESCSPNPAASTARVRFSVHDPVSLVSLDLFDARGGRVLSVPTERLEAGTYTRTVDVRDLTPGTYYLRLRVGETTSRERLVVVR